MSDSKRQKPESTRTTPDVSGSRGGAPEELRQQSGPLETLFQEVIRRTTALGLSGFFMTEEAVRKAVNDSVPKDWVDYFGEQSNEVRGELIKQLSTEFGKWLKTVDLADVLTGLLREFDVTAKIEIKARETQEESLASLKVMPRHKS